MSEVFAQGVERNIQRFMSVLQGDDEPNVLRLS
jgi:TetR/AcrR family transcriptional repressor of nem operon